MNDNSELEYFLSDGFKEDMLNIVNSETLNKNLPKVYLNSNNELVKEYPDGRIEILKKIKTKTDFDSNNCCPKIKKYGKNK